ncbi:MAG: MATE family efflux transporter [Clostridia bacterium]|nr:MATE family efflux transporter [Clostridia bacterium]
MYKTEIKLSDHFDIKRMLKFTMPSIIMMVFTSIYSVVDGFFVSNFVNKTAFAAVNFIMPVLMILGTVGWMFGAGGSALVAMTLGMGKREKANKIFSMIVYLTVAISALISLVSFIFLPNIASILGAEGKMLEDCVLYGRIIIVALPFFMLQFEFQSFFITAEKPKLGLLTTVISGVANMVLDALLIAVLDMGLVGAALATAISQSLGGIIPVVYFACKNSSLLRLTSWEFDGRALLKTCTNGSSEFMNNISMSVVSMVYNIQLMRFAGEDGVAAYGVLMYVNMIFISTFIGFAVGIAPVVGFHFGAKNHDELHGLLVKSLKIISVCAVLMLIFGELLAYPLSYIFVGYDEALMSMTHRGFVIYSLSFLFSGFAIYGSTFFTALNDGLTSAIMAFLRTLVFQIAAVLLFPLVWELDGIWFSIVAAEIAAVLLNVFFLVVKRKKYNY